jgi:HSP20 family protein
MPDLTPRRNNDSPAEKTGTDLFDMFKSNLLDDFMDMTRSGFRTDIKEHEDEYVIEAELPGLDKDNITLEINNNNLIISANKEEIIENKGENYIRRERRTGSYQRSFRLENVEKDEIEAQYENGILEINLPKKEEGQESRQTIDIN